jgi:hypothetical protein
LAEQLLQQALRSVAADSAVRQSLPLGADFSDSATLHADAELARSALIEALRHADLEQLAAALRQADRGTQRAAPIGPLKQLEDSQSITSETPIRLRAHLSATVDQVGQRSVLRSRAGDFPISEDDAAPIKALLATNAARAEDLGVDLARRLLLAGLAVVE